MARTTSLFLGLLGASTFGVLLAGAGCGGPGAVGEAVRPPDPTASGALGEPSGGEGGAQCRAVGSYAEPLVVDLKSNERLDLELAMKEGVAIVSYDCKSLKLLKGCKLSGTYGFAGVSRKEDVVQITSSDELAANLPFSAVTLGGEVSSGSSIDLALVMVGKKGTTVADAAKDDLVGSCEGATHFIKSAVVGAFAMATGTKGKARAVTEIFGASAQAGSSSEKRTANKDGDPEACRTASPDAPKPPDQCQSAIRLELVALTGKSGGEATAQGGERGEGDKGPRNPCPEGMVLSGGKCTTGDDKPHLCDREDLKDCAVQCEKGDAGSCHHLAWGYRTGKALPRDEAKAIELFEKACSGGEASSCYQRGDAYMRARLDPKSSEDAKTEARLKAEEYYNKACQLGNGWVCWSISDWYLRDGSLAVFPKDPARAISLVRRGCNLGYAPSCSTLARHLIDGKITQQDVPGAMSLLQRACDGGRWEDCETIGNLYRDGKGVNKNPVAAIGAYERACDHGGVRACHSGGEIYAKGDGLPKDPAKARAFYEKGCGEKGAGWDACKALGEVLEKGIGGPKDMARAAEVYERGCTKGGCLRAGQIWEKGEGGVKADPERALKAYQTGCNRSSDRDACRAYGKLLEGKDKEQAKAFWTDYCNRMGLAEKWACGEAKRLGGVGVPAK